MRKRPKLNTYLEAYKSVSSGDKFCCDFANDDGDYIYGCGARQKQTTVALPLANSLRRFISPWSNLSVSAAIRSMSCIHLLTSSRRGSPVTGLELIARESTPINGSIGARYSSSCEQNRKVVSLSSRSRRCEVYDTRVFVRRSRTCAMAERV